jgi:4-amino-4-deoxy-L-arabinose transferase-like glycosyltransferase
MNKKTFLILLIFIFSFVFRFFDLVNTPEGFDQTEAAFGYNAYSVIKSGGDEYGVKYPLILTSVGDFKLAGYMYWEVPFVAIFGLSEFSVRLSALVASLITLILIYHITHALIHSHRMALLTVLFTSIAPWHLLLSRMGYDPIIAMTMYLTSVSLFLVWIKTKKIIFLLISMFTLCWAILTYYAVWVIFPFTIFAFFIVVYKKSRNLKKCIIPFIIILLPVIFTTKIFLITRGERLNQDSTYQAHAQPVLEEMIREDQQEFNPLLTRSLHNKVIVYPQFILSNFFHNLNFDFLFLSGDKIDRRFYTPYTGVLYLWMSPFIFLGILFLWKKKTMSASIFVLGTIAIVFLGSAFSEFGSETERTLLAVPLFSFYAGYGLYNGLKEINKISYRLLAYSFLCIILIFNIACFDHQYFWHAKVHEPWGRAYGTKEMISSLSHFKRDYKTIVIPDSSYIFYYFYNTTDPRQAVADSKSRLESANFDGYLTMPMECPAAGKLKTLYVCLGNKVPKNSKIVKSIRYKDGQPSFTFIEFTNEPSNEDLVKNLTYYKKWGYINSDENVWWKTEEQL